MVNRVLKVFIELNSQSCSPKSERVNYEFSLCESHFFVEALNEYFKVDYINDKYVKLTVYGDEIKVLMNFPYHYHTNDCPHLITLLYIDIEEGDEMTLPNYLLEIEEHRINEDSYSKNERNEISYMEPITYNAFPLQIVDKNIYIKKIDIENKKVDVLCGENSDEGELRTVSLEIDGQFMDTLQGGNTEESFYHITNYIKIRLIEL